MAAQPSAGARLILTVLDPSGARVPNVSMSVLERNGVPLPTPRSYLGPRGRIVADDLVPAVYGLRVDAAGFAPAFVRKLRVSGEVRHTVRLTIERVAETVVVDAGPQQAALDARGFSTLLTREQIDALPDDPAEMAAVLRDLAPPGAVIRIDGFAGGLMPPKSQILSIRLPRLDSYAAQEHGGLTALSAIEIVTTPGGGRIQGATDLSWRHQALNARNPLTHAPPPDTTRSAAVTLDGPLLPEVASFALAVRGGLLRVAEAVRAIDADGQPITATPVRTQEWLAVSGRLITSAWGGQTARVSVSSEHRAARNVGAGGLDLPERGHRSTSVDWTVRAASSGAVGRRAFLESRLELRRAGQRTIPATEAITVRVLDAFHAGGAQIAGGERVFDMMASVDLEYGRGVHAVRTGVLVERTRQRSGRHLNYLGTYTFTSLDAYRAGRPATYSRRLGRPVSALTNLQVAAYAQDDVRLRRSMLVGYGIRYERQSLAGGPGRVLPRASLAWSPSARGTTTVRGGAGLFSEWVAPEVYHQARLVDGTQQVDLLVHQPAWPEPDEATGLVRRERYALSSDLRLPLVAAASVGLEQQMGSLIRVHAGYSSRRAWHLLRGREHRAPPGEPSPDGAEARVIEAVSDAGLRTHTLSLQASSVGAGRRTTLVAAYVYSHARNNTAGAFLVPPGGRLEEEWGATLPTHLFTASATIRLFRPVTLSLIPRWRSGFPYSTTTGVDSNQDGLFTERPSGTPRNAQRTPAQFDLGARLSFAIGIGRRRPATGTGRDGRHERTSAQGVDAPAGAASSRYRLELFAAAQNVTNRPTVTAVGNVVGSPLYGRPLAALDPRRVDFGIRIGF